MSEERPHYPIIYVREYAATQGEVNEMTDDPFKGIKESYSWWPIRWVA